MKRKGKKNITMNLTIPITITTPDRDGIHQDTAAHYRMWLQAMASRRWVGELRYEKGRGPIRRQKYLTRLKREVEAYEKTGNVEHLINVANYAFLENEKPERPGGCHWDAMVESVARHVGSGGNKFE